MEFDINRTTLIGNNRNSNRNRIRIDMELIYKMIDDENKTVTEICRMFCCSRSTLQRCHRRYQEGNPVTKRKYMTGNIVNRSSHYKYVNMEKILEEIDGGKTIKEICEEKKISRTTLRRKFLQYREEKLKEIKEDGE